MGKITKERFQKFWDYYDRKANKILAKVTYRVYNYYKGFVSIDYYKCFFMVVFLMRLDPEMVFPFKRLCIDFLVCYQILMLHVYYLIIIAFVI